MAAVAKLKQKPCLPTSMQVFGAQTFERCRATSDAKLKSIDVCRFRNQRNVSNFNMILRLPNGSKRPLTLAFGIPPFLLYKDD